jgi:hypothetical protein
MQFNTSICVADAVIGKPRCKIKQSAEPLLQPSAQAIHFYTAAQFGRPSGIAHAPDQNCSCWGTNRIYHIDESKVWTVSC